jgi:heme/copper-type cytochrome/quinol oxidase subunit 1
MHLLATVNHLICAGSSPSPPAGDVPNPIEGWTPDFGGLGPLQDIARNIITVIWAGAILIVIGIGVVGLVGMARHQHSGHPGEYRQASAQAKNAGIVLALLIAFPLIVGVIFSVVQS